MFVVNMAAYNLFGVRFETPQSETTPPVIAETMIGVQPEFDLSPSVAVQTTLSLVDSVTINYDSWLFSISLLPVGTGIKAYIEILSGRTTYYIPMRSVTAGPIDLLTATSFPLNAPYGIPLPTGSTIKVYAVAAAAGQFIQAQYLMISVAGVP